MPVDAPAPRGGVLVLSGYGIRVCVERGYLQVEDGVGAHRRSERFSRSERKLKRLVVLGHAGTISLDSLRWLSDVGASFVQIDHDGKLIAGCGPSGLDDARLRRAQALAVENGRGFDIAVGLVREKLIGQRALLRRLPGGVDAEPVLERLLGRLDSAKRIETLRAFEAEAALGYWNAWAGTGIRFVKQEAKRVPDHWKVFERRSSGVTGNPRRATCPANAILNYLYAMVEAEARIASVAVGLDPGLGFMHADQKSRDSLACDLMEPIRPQVDQWVLSLLARHTFRKADFFERRDGICRLMPEIARVLAETAPEWKAALAPIAESVARDALREPIATPLTQSNRKAGRDKHRKRSARSKPPSLLSIPTVCERCGVELPHRAQRHCRECLVIEHPNHRAEVLRANAEWERSSGAESSLEFYEREVAPRVTSLSVDEIMKATGLSRSYAAMIRRGVRVPHARHWEALVESRNTA